MIQKIKRYFSVPVTDAKARHSLLQTLRRLDLFEDPFDPRVFVPGPIRLSYLL